MRSKFKWILTLLVAFSMQFSFAQEKTITGTVSDSSGPMPGVNVVVKGTQRGASTNFDGTYSIKAKVGETLVYSFLGLSDASRTVGAENVLNVMMQESAKELENVVITGLGIKRKVDAITGTYTVVKADELNRAAAPNAVQALIGKVSGLQINTTNSGVNSENRVVLRAPRSITGNNQALIVIDGAISSLGTFQQLPPEVIASVNVIKSANGSALYGSDGVNGVIVVTTKKGAGDKFSVNINSSADFTEIAYVPVQQRRYGQGWDGKHAIQENGSWGPEFDGTLYPTGLPQADGTYVVAPYTGRKNNLKRFFQTGLVLQNGINISGGSLETGYATLSINRTTNDFVLKNDQLKRNSFLLKAGKQMGKFSIEGNINYITSRVKQAESGLYTELLDTASNIPIERFANSGNEGHWNTYNLNPYWLRDNQRETLNSDLMAAIVTLNYQVNKNISLKYLGNLRLNMDSDLNYRNAYKDITNPTYGGLEATVVGEVATSTSFRRRFYGDLFINFDYKLTDDLSLTAILGNNIQDDFRKSNAGGGQKFAVPGVYNVNNILNPYTATQTTLLGGALQNNQFLQRKIGVFANVDFGYKDFLFLNLQARQDWSSVFKASGNTFFYPSAGLSFVPTKAFENIKGSVLNYMKVTANYTRTGNDSAVGPYAINQLGNLGIGYPLNDLNSYVQQLAPTDKNISPEFVTTKEASVNFGFFNDRLTLDGSYYEATTSNLITRASTSGTVGFNSILRTVGVLQTNGYEIDLGFTPIKSAEPRGFRWDNKLNFTKYKSIVTKVSDDATQVSIRQPFGFVGIFAEKGQEFPLIKGQTYLKDSFGRTILNANGLPSIDPQQKILGKVNPDYIIGFNSSIAYRGIRLSATMDYRTGHQFFSNTKRSLTQTGNTLETAANRSGFILPNSSFDYNGNGTIEANEANTNVVTAGAGVPSLINYYNNFYVASGENLVLDATAFKVREATLSYSFDKKAIEKTGLSALSVSVNARNPVNIFSKQNRNYNDPETSETTGNAGGLAFNDRYPAQSSYGFAINLTF